MSADLQKHEKVFLKISIVFAARQFIVSGGFC